MSAVETPGEAGVERDDAGILGESEACSRFGLVHVANDPGSPEWIDARADDGTPVDAKACALRVRSGSSTRRGRWWFSVQNHRLLADAGGDYVLVVYQPASLDVLAIQRIGARELERAVSGFDVDPERGSLSVQVRYPEIFPTLDASLGGSA